VALFVDGCAFVVHGCNLPSMQPEV
jgi:hypothetical protein